MTTEKEIQSMLLRLSILLATSLQTLSERIPHNITSDPSSSNISIGSNFQSQVLNDINVLLENIQKACTDLTLALRNDKFDQATLTDAVDFSPTLGLDGPSLDAAAAQLEDLTRDFVPKLTWLSRKASSEAKLSVFVPKTEEDKQREAKKRDLLSSQGGLVIEYELYKKDEKLERVKGTGVGLAWSNAIKIIVLDILAALGDLGNAYMSGKTKEVVRRASEARAKVGGWRINTITDRQEANSMQRARKEALQATAIVWEKCEAALQGKLPKNNKEAVINNWRVRSETLQDALRELKEALQVDVEAKDATDHQDDLQSQQDDFDLPRSTFTPEERKRAQDMEELLRSGCQLYSKAGSIALKKEEDDIDFDDLDGSGTAFADVVDFLVSSVVYGEEIDSGDEYSDEDGDRSGEERIREAPSEGLFDKQVAHIESLCQTLLID